MYFFSRFVLVLLSFSILISFSFSDYAKAATSSSYNLIESTNTNPCVPETGGTDPTVPTPTNPPVTRPVEPPMSVMSTTNLYDDSEECDDIALEESFENVLFLINQTKNLALNDGLVIYDDEYDLNAGTTKAIKTAITWTLNNKNTIFKWYQSVAGKKSRTSLEKRFNKYIEPALKELKELDTLVWREVEDAIYRSIRSTGLKDTTCRSIAFWLKHVMTWLV